MGIFSKLHSERMSSISKQCSASTRKMLVAMAPAVGEGVAWPLFLSPQEGKHGT